MGRRLSYINRFPGEVMLGGVNVLSTAPNKVYWVSSVVGSSTNNGLTYNKPLATITAALAKCTANKGDIIFVLPGHVESITAAAGIAIDKAGVTIIGLGNKNLRPTITFSTATTADLNVDAANATLKNFRFISSIASLDAPIDVNAAGFSLLDCEFYCTNSSSGFDITVITDANADDLLVEGCSFNYWGNLASGTVDTTATEAIRLVGTDRAVIRGNFFSGDFTTSVINGITTASRDIKIIDNDIYNIATEDIAGVVDLVAGCTGMIAGNRGFMGYVTSLAAIIDPASCAMVDNYFSNVVTEAGGLVGTAST